MAWFRKIKAGLVKSEILDYVGYEGNIFFNIESGELRLSDGETPHGLPICLSTSDIEGIIDDTITNGTLFAASNYVVRERHNATTDGQTGVSLDFTPVLGTEMVFVNGILMEEGVSNDYTITGSIITFNVGLQYHATFVDKRDKVSVTYFKQAQG